MVFVQFTTLFVVLISYGYFKKAMKIIIASILINCFSLPLLFSQNLVLTDDFKLEEVVRVESASKEQLFQNAKHWVFKLLKSSDNLIHLDDENNNNIIATANLMLETRVTFACMLHDTKLDYKLTIALKDGRYKYTIDNMIHRYVGNCGEGENIHRSAYLKDIGFSKKKRAKVYKEVDQKLKVIIADLKQSMVTPIAEADW